MVQLLDAEPSPMGGAVQDYAGASNPDGADLRRRRRIRHAVADAIQGDAGAHAGAW